MRTTHIAAVLVAALATSAGTAAAAPRTTRPVPVIHEQFTTLPCTGSPAHRTTVEMEGCAEHQVRRSDKTIDGLARTIYGKLSRSGRLDFVSASDDWLSYRNAQCRAAASPEAGGSEAPVVYAECLATEDSAHITDLRTFLQDSFPAGPRAAARR